MPSIINSDDGVVSGTSGLKTTGGNDGALNIQANGANAISVAANGTVTLPAAALPVASGGTGITSVGTSGNVLTSNGTVWVSQAISVSTPTERFYTSPATWTKPAGLVSIKVTIQGAGGGGGGARGGGIQPICGPFSIDSSGGIGGYGGGTVEWIPAPSIPGPVVVTVGAGGTAGPAPATFRSTSSGGTGGTTSFGAFCSVTGGAGASAGPTPPSTNSGSTGISGSGGVGSGGNINLTGFSGEPSSNDRGTRALVATGGGATSRVSSTSFFNTAWTPAPGPGNGVTGEYGQGGGGALSIGTGTVPAPTATPQSGGVGGAGYIIVEEFYS